MEKKAIKSDSNEDIKIISPADMFGKNPVNRQEATKISRQSLKQVIHMEDNKKRIQNF